MNDEKQINIGEVQAAIFGVDARQEIRIQQVDANLDGRDFVCGDMHGMFSLVTQFLQHVNFDCSKDRLFACGDLVDRGPQNEDCLRLLDNPWFYSVLGNHEQLMLEYAADQYSGRFWPRNGGGWGTKYFPRRDVNPWDRTSYAGEYTMQDFCDVRRIVFQKVPKLPHIITVKQKNGKKFHIIHAEFNPNAKVTDEVLADPALAKNVAFAQSDDGDSITWGRYTFYRFYGEDLSSPRMLSKFKRWIQINKQYRLYNDDLSMIYSGHTPVHLPLKFYGQINLDTMAYDVFSKSKNGGKPNKKRGLSFVNPDTGECWLSNHEGVNTNQIVTLDNVEDIEDAEGSQ